MLPRTRKRREPGWGDAAKQVLESVKHDMDVPEILEQINKNNIKTIRGSIDERDALRRVLEQTPEVFYCNKDKFGLATSNRRSSAAATAPKESKRNSDNKRSNGSNSNNSAQHQTNGSKKTRKDSSESRARKISNDDLLSPETPLIGLNFKDFINEERFNKFGAHIQWELMKLLPSCDVDIGAGGMPQLGRDCFSNEFINRALTGFHERIQDGEFTAAMKARINIESSRRRIDPWKEKFFEEYWGQLKEKEEPQRQAKWARLEKGIKKELKSPLKLTSPKRSPRNSPKWPGVSPTRSSPQRNSPRASPKKTKNYPEINRSDQTVIKSWDAINAVRSLQTNIKAEEPKRTQSVIKQVKKETSQGSSVTASPAGSSLVSSDSPASQRGPSTSPNAALESPKEKEKPRDSPPPPLLHKPTNPEPKLIRVIHQLPSSVPCRLPPGNTLNKAANFAQLKLPPIPALIPSPNYTPMVGQKRTRTLADAKAEMAKMKRPTVISYAPPFQRGTPVRVIKQVQKAVPTDRVLILSPVVSNRGVSPSSSQPEAPLSYRLSSNATPLQKASLGTQVISTVQLQQGEKTYVIKPAGQLGKPILLANQSSPRSVQKNRVSVVQSCHTPCRNETYAQCTRCQVLVQLTGQLSGDHFVCQTCLASSASSSSSASSYLSSTRK